MREFHVTGMCDSRQGEWTYPRSASGSMSIPEAICTWYPESGRFSMSGLPKRQIFQKKRCLDKGRCDRGSPVI